MNAPDIGEEWISLSDRGLPVAEATPWLIQPSCGAVVLFCGTVRDHAEGRPGVSSLDYEAYADQVHPRLSALAAETRDRWRDVGRIVLWHRVGRLAVQEVSVVVGVSAPHRGEAFEAARWAIDTLKATVPIWKHETWESGSDWGLNAMPVGEVSR